MVPKSIPMTSMRLPSDRSRVHHFKRPILDTAGVEAGYIGEPVGPPLPQRLALWAIQSDTLCKT